MPGTNELVSTINDITTALVLVGVATLVLSLAAGGVALHFSWFDVHAGHLLKRILLSSIGGSLMTGGSGALGKWLMGKFQTATAPTQPPLSNAAELLHPLLAHVQVFAAQLLTRPF